MKHLKLSLFLLFKLGFVLSIWFVMLDSSRNSEAIIFLVLMILMSNIKTSGMNNLKVSEHFGVANYFLLLNLFNDKNIVKIEDNINVDAELADASIKVNPDTAILFQKDTYRAMMYESVYVTALWIGVVFSAMSF